MAVRSYAKAFLRQASATVRRSAHADRGENMKIRQYDGQTLSLKNDGRLELFFVGVGAAFTKRHYQTNFLIIKGKDHLMVDCGTRTPQALIELGVKISDIQNYFITHTHADHIGGLEEVMITGRYITGKKPNIIISKDFQHLLWDTSLKGGSGFNENLEQSEKTLSLGDMWNVTHPKWLNNYPRDTFEANVGSINLKIFRSMHIPDNADSWQTSFWSTGLIIDNRIMFSGDTRFDPELVQSFSKKFKLGAIFHDCQFFTGGVHAGLEELRGLPARIKKKMFLLHYGDNWEDWEEKVKKYGFKGLCRQWCFYNFG